MKDKISSYVGLSLVGISFIVSVLLLLFPSPDDAGRSVTDDDVGRSKFEDCLSCFEFNATLLVLFELSNIRLLSLFFIFIICWFVKIPLDVDSGKFIPLVIEFSASFSYVLLYSTKASRTVNSS